jgi:ribonuclease HI
MTWDKETGPILQMGSDKMIPRYVDEKPFTIRFPIEVNGTGDSNPTKKGLLIWYTDGSKTERGSRAGVYYCGTRIKLSFSLGRHTMVYQAEVYAIKACADENMDRSYKNRNIYILSESQAAIKALGKYQITSKLVWECHQSLMQLARQNRVQLVRVPGHEGIAGNETADYLARTGSEHAFTGPEPACGISSGVAKRAVRDWMNKNHIKQWESLTGLKQAKELIVGPSAKRSKDLLRLNRDQLRWIVGLLTGHCHLKGHLFKLGLAVDPTIIANLLFPSFYE